MSEFEPASVHLEATIVPRPGSPIVKGLRTLGTLALAVGLGDVTGGPSVADLVVTRVGTGREVMRTSAGSLLDADRLLTQVRDDLETKTVAEFFAEWRLDEG